MQEMFSKLKKELPEIKKDISLKDFCTFHIGGNAKFFLETGDYEEVKKALSFCIENGIKFYVIGGGSNLLISDEGFDGLVVAYRKKFQEVKLSESDFKDIGEGRYMVDIDGAMFLADTVGQVSALGFTGLEWAAGIPGTIAGAINGNAGAFNGVISDSIISLKVLQIKDAENREIIKEDCKFSYRSSIFKKNSDYIIVSGKFFFKKKNVEEINKSIQDVIAKRLGKHPKGFSAGSVFKNYEGDIDQKLFKKYPELKSFKERGIIPVGYLIDKCNLKGTKIGDAKISDEHGNFIINLGQAKSDNVLKLISLIKKEVKNKFGIDIQEEIKHL